MSDIKTQISWTALVWLFATILLVTFNLILLRKLQIEQKARVTSEEKRAGAEGKIREITMNTMKSWQNQMFILPEYEKGIKAIETKNHEESVKIFSKIIEHDPDDALALYLRANSFLALGKNYEAYLDLSNYLMLIPSSSWSYLLRAQILLKFGKKDPARADLKSALQLDPSLEEAKALLKEIGE